MIHCLRSKFNYSKLHPHLKPYSIELSKLNFNFCLILFTNKNQVNLSIRKHRKFIKKHIIKLLSFDYIFINVNYTVIKHKILILYTLQIHIINR